ncbi:hypothetical protein PAMA_007270 [Pampus argenteus]
MSRRRVSVRDLGAVDCEGWLHRRKEGRSFLGSKWKRYWFVLAKSSLYWYNDKMAEKAEGFINLSGFTIEQAKQCRKKHAMTASHPQVVTIFIAAESFTEMNKWISKLSAAAEPCDLINAEECYSEGSDQDDDDSVLTSCCPADEQEPADSGNEDVPQSVSLGRSRSTLEGPLSRNRSGGRRCNSAGSERLSWLNGAAVEASLPLLNVKEVEEEEVHGKHLEPHLVIIPATV